MIRNTPLRSKRAEPRRKLPERTAHVRTKRKATDVSPLEAFHMQRVRELGCCVTNGQPVHVHHLLKAPSKRCKRDHRWTVALVPVLHEALHAMGSEARFNAMWDVDLEAIAAAQWAESERLWAER